MQVQTREQTLDENEQQEPRPPAEKPVAFRVEPYSPNKRHTPLILPSTGAEKAPEQDAVENEEWLLPVDDDCLETEEVEPVTEVPIMVIPGEQTPSEEVEAEEGEYTEPEEEVAQSVSADLVSITTINVGEETAETPDAEAEATLEALIEASVRAQKRRRRHAFFLLSLVLLAFLLLGALGGVFWSQLPWAGAQAQLTLYAQKMRVSASLSLTENQVGMTSLAQVIKTASMTLPTTGTQYQPALRAHGALVFYSLLPYQYTLSAATFTGKDGIEVALDESVTIPARVGGTPGQISASAHAVYAGSGGNIAVDDINGSTTISDIVVENTAPFTGGQNRVPYQAVAPQDVKGPATTLKQQLAAEIQEQDQKLVSADQTLLPLSCTSTVSSSTPVGSAATTVTVSVTQSCQATAYSTAQMGTLAQHALQKVTPSRFMVTAISQVSGTVKDGLFTGQVSGIAVYPWSAAQKDHLVHLLVGKNRQQAAFLLSQQQGIDHYLLAFPQGQHVLPPSIQITVIF